VLFLSEKELDGASPLVRASISLENASQQQLNKVKIREMILRFQRKPGDTGSPEVQIAVLTHRVRNLERHMAEFKKDHFMRRRLEQLRGKQRRMLRYLERTDYERFKFVAHHLSLNLPLPATRENLKIIRAQRKEQRKLEEEKRLASDMSKKEIRAEERRKILDKQIAYIASRKKP
jgi:small subunit ribosomal protein S15